MTSVFSLTKHFAQKAQKLFAGGLMMLAVSDCSAPIVEVRIGQAVIDADDVCVESAAFAVNFENPVTPRLFGVGTIPSFNGDDSAVNEKWFAMLGRHYSLMQNPENAETFNTWLSQLEGARGKTIAEKAMAVDELVDNTIRYVKDDVLYGEKRSDYWASPLETLSAHHKGYNGWGDCEDYAFLKYFAMRYLDVPVDKLFGVIVHVTDDDGNVEGHLMLMVDVMEASGSEPRLLIMNNQESPVTGGQLEAEFEHKNYSPYYAFNEKGPLLVPANSSLKWGDVLQRKRACFTPEAVNQNGHSLKMRL